MIDPLASAVVAWDLWLAERSPRSAIATRQNARVQDLVEFARLRSTAYGELYRGLGRAARLSDLPPITKPWLMERFDACVTDPTVSASALRSFLGEPSLIGHPFRGRHAVWKSSGTTGSPGIFVHDEHALAIYDGLFALRMWPRLLAPSRMCRLLAQGGRMACVAATNGHYAGVSSWKRLAALNPWLGAGIHICSVSAPLDQLVAELNGIAPAALVGYPSMLVRLAHEQQAGRLRLDPLMILCGGECLDHAEQALIEAAFACRVHDVYGASEFGYLAFDCDEGWLHVNADWAVLEAVDGEYRAVPPGVPSRTCLLTNLANRVQPLIRYDLGDSITYRPEPCPCGSPLPAVRVEGRRDQVLEFRRAGRRGVAVLPLALASILEAIPGLRRFQVIQTEAAAVAVRIETDPGTGADQVWAAARPELARFFAAQGLPDVRVERADQPPADDPRTGKFRQVWSALERKHRP